jgi:hypothetical protein
MGQRSAALNWPTRPTGARQPGATPAGRRGEPAVPLSVRRSWIPRQSVRFGGWPPARLWSSCRSRSLPLQSSATSGDDHAHSHVSRRKPLGTLRSGRRIRSPLVNRLGLHNSFEPVGAGLRLCGRHVGPLGSPSRRKNQRKIVRSRPNEIKISPNSGRWSRYLGLGSRVPLRSSCQDARCCV